MSSKIPNLFKPLESPGKLRTHQDKDTETEIKQTYCSTFIHENHILVKGECNNPDQQKRNAMLIFFDTNKGEKIGKNKIVLVYYSFPLRTTNSRQWKNI
jgi:hypothetical protein